MTSNCFPVHDEVVVVRTVADGFQEGIYCGYNETHHRHVVELLNHDVVEVEIGDLFINPKDHQDD